MRRYLVVAHKTLGGPHLLDELHRLREDDPYCTFHLVVPEHHPGLRGWDELSVKEEARRVLDEMLERLAEIGIGATGEVGDKNPVSAVGDAMRREGQNGFSGIVLSTLPKGVSRWWVLDVPRRMAAAYPNVPVTHIIAEDHLV